MNDKINKAVDNLEVVATSAVTWIATIILVLNFLLTQDVVVEIDGAAEVIGRIVSTLTGVILIIRRVTPVPKSERGLVA